MTKQRIIEDFSAHLLKNGGLYKDWYAGITSDADQRLFIDHSVSKNYGVWIHAPADSNQDARLVETHFLDLGFDGGSGGGDYTSKVVYLYKKSSYTKP